MNILKKDFKEDKIILVSGVIVTLLLTVLFGFYGAYCSILIFTIFIGSGIISKEKDKIDFLFSKPITREKIFFLKLFTSALYILILFASAFIVIGLIVESRRSCFACSQYVIYFYKNPADFLPDKSYLPLLFSFIPVFFSIPFFFSILTYDLSSSFLLGSIIFFFLDTLAGVIGKVDTFNYPCNRGFYTYFHFLISAIFLILSYKVFKREDID